MIKKAISWVLLIGAVIWIPFYCGFQPKQVVASYPQFVHNVCTGRWAIKTGRPWTAHKYCDYTKWYFEDMYVGPDYDRPVVRLNIYKDSVYQWWSADTGKDVSLGNETTFPDSLSAVNWWKRFKANADAQQRAAALKKREADSIYHCQHTYE